MYLYDLNLKKLMNSFLYEEFQSVKIKKCKFYQIIKIFFSSIYMCIFLNVIWYFTWLKGKYTYTLANKFNICMYIRQRSIILKNKFLEQV